MRLLLRVPALRCASGFLPNSTHTQWAATRQQPGTLQKPIDDNPNLTLGHLSGLDPQIRQGKLPRWTLSVLHCLGHVEAGLCLPLHGFLLWYQSRPGGSFCCQLRMHLVRCCSSSSNSAFLVLAAVRQVSVLSLSMAPAEGRHSAQTGRILWHYQVGTRAQLPEGQHGGGPDAAASWSLPLEFSAHTSAAITIHSETSGQGNPSSQSVQIRAEGLPSQFWLGCFAGKSPVQD